ncbi:ABC-F family ATP-binding cassette domain-containing protein [Actinotignum urinale]|uniref:ABC-F family ATP-binding cassette domain-containing protein n=1 Tax=Actinotignum urinale TaxID=190146 RepID=UPI002A829613|nr:ABC-F family ATP-binding cassette domain-containing protein [Actinotignum urinale]MDY5128680.1 ABC-F family ATP-binding cassette domain-containing protein [Actinotignum urinale]
MAHLLSTQNIGMTLGARHILSNISLSLEDGNRIGVVGPNGGGKTTLMRMIAGDLEPTEGKITAANNVRYALLSQNDSLPDTTVQEAIHGGVSTFTWASDARVRELHAGLLPDIPLDARVDELSGGQRRRVALAHTLTRDANVLILDEPTNHLDVEGITFLAGYLNERFGGPRAQGACVCITHDRWFLDAVATRLWEVIPGVETLRGQIPGRVDVYEGGYSDYIFQRTERQREAAVAEEKRQNLLRKELAWLRRGAPARTSKPRFRVEAAEALIADVPAPRDTVDMMKMASSRLGKEVVNLEDVSFTYPGADAPTLTNVTWRLAPGERVGILGPNGAGKSTLLALLAGRVEPSGGHVKRGVTVKLAELSQHTRELDKVADLRVVESVAEVAQHVTVGKKEMSASQLTERMGFTKERAWTRVSDISGGERRRLQFMRLLMAEPNVLLLDEPTNDLDTDTLAAMEDVLDGWAGTLIVVSHDRYLLERMTDRQMCVIQGGLRDLPGGVEEYLRLRAEQIAQAQEENERKLRESSPSYDDGSPELSATTALTNAQRREARKEAARIERKMEKVRQQLEKVREKTAELSTGTDYEAMAEAGRQDAELCAQLDALEEEWLIAAEQAEG